MLRVSISSSKVLRVNDRHRDFLHSWLHLRCHESTLIDIWLLFLGHLGEVRSSGVLLAKEQVSRLYFLILSLSIEFCALALVI